MRTLCVAIKIVHCKHWRKANSAINATYMKKRYSKWNYRSLRSFWFKYKLLKRSTEETACHSWQWNNGHIREGSVFLMHSIYFKRFHTEGGFPDFHKDYRCLNRKNCKSNYFSCHFWVHFCLAWCCPCQIIFRKSKVTCHQFSFRTYTRWYLVLQIGLEKTNHSWRYLMYFCRKMLTNPSWGCQKTYTSIISTRFQNPTWKQSIYFDLQNRVKWKRKISLNKLWQF